LLWIVVQFLAVVHQSLVVEIVAEMAVDLTLAQKVRAKYRPLLIVTIIDINTK
jgi:hypothetical protein